MAYLRPGVYIEETLNPNHLSSVLTLTQSPPSWAPLTRAQWPQL